MKKILAVLLCLGMLISWQFFQGDDARAKENKVKPNGKAFECSIAGTWRAEGGDGFSTFIPLDPTGRRFTVFLDTPLPHLNLESTMYQTQYRGMAVKVSPNLYKYSVTQIVVDYKNPDEPVKAYEVEVSGFTKVINCDTRLLNYTVKVIPEGGNSFCYESGTDIVERYEIGSPCPDLPPFEYPEED